MGVVKLGWELKLNWVSKKSSHLYENSAYNNGNWTSDEKILSVNTIRQSESQGEADCPSQASVGEAKLVLVFELDGTERVDDLSQHQNTFKTKCWEVTGFKKNLSD